MKAIGIDVGGTFTDFIYFDHELDRVEVLKVSSGRDIAATIAGGIVELCDACGVTPAELDLVMHGTTVATNAILQYQGAKTAMITTEGFRDVIHIGRHQRPQNYSIQQDIPWQARPLVHREYRIPVAERLAPPDGEVLVPLDRDAVRAAAERLRDEGIEAVAICFLFSYLDDRHERLAAEIVREVMPGTFVCTSSEVVRQFREFERFTTTAVNAFVGPEMLAYIERLEAEIKRIGVHAPLQIMQSNGGTATPRVAADYPVRAILSGPVGGVMGGLWAQGRAAAADAAEGNGSRRRRKLATLDVGGTSADIGIVTDDRLVEARARDTWIAGYPIMVPIIDIHTIGAGGGSVAHLDRAGALHVGPRSAGAHPGPAAYGRGGNEPTVTDANVVLGRLPHTLAGALELDRDAAARVVGELASQMGRTSVEAASAIIRIVNENMAAALRSTTIERGLDPREFLLCAFGGGGPAQAVELARILEIPEVLIPPHPGVTSATGLLTSDLRYDAGQSYLRPLAAVEAPALGAMLEEHERALRAQLQADGRSDDEIRFERAADLRYTGQSYELKVPIADEHVTEETLVALREAFHRSHAEEFGHSFPELEVELVTLKVTGLGLLPHIEGARAADARASAGGSMQAEVHFDVDGETRAFDTPVLERDRMSIGRKHPGPAIIVQADSTTIVPPGATARRDTADNLLILV